MGFAVQGLGVVQSEGPVAFAPEPLTRWQAAQAGGAAAFFVWRPGAREEEARADLWRRHDGIEKRLGATVPRSRFMTGDYQVFNPTLGEFVDLTDVHGERQMDERAAGVSLTDLGQGGLDDAAYEARIDALRRERPEVMAGVPTKADLDRARDARLRGLAARSQQAFEEHPVSAFAGSAVGTMLDPVNVLATMYTGPLGAGRGLATRMLLQGGANAAVELAQQPAKAGDAAAFGGPEWTPGQAAGDVLGAGVGGAGFELGGAVLKGAFRQGGRALERLRARAAADPATRRAMEVVDTALRDDAAIGDVTGEEFDAALGSLERGGPPPRLTPDRDLGDLFEPVTSRPDTVKPVGAMTVNAEADYRGRRIYTASFDPQALDVDAARFQYKADADGEGVTARLRGVEAWDATASGKVIVWEAADGRLIVADGHQRRGLARRMGEKGWDARLDGYLFREADGWDARQVRVVAALKNIREGSGAILDAAKVLRDAADALEDRSLPVTGEFITQARQLAKLSPQAFRAVVNQVIPERYGAAIGEMAAERPDLHEGMVRLLKEGDPSSAGEARALIFEALQDDWIRTQGVTGDLFGYDPAVPAMIARAKVAAAVQGAIGRDANLYAQLVRNADAIEAGGNALARDANQARLALDRAALEVAGRLALRHGPVGEAMAAAAGRVAREEMSAAKAAQPVVRMLRAAIKAGEDLETSRGASLNPDAPGPAATRVADAFDDPNGAAAKAQIEPAPEDVALEAGQDAPGLFDDLPERGGFARARERLAACAPGG